MLPPLNLPVSLLGVLMAVRPCFTAPSFTTFCGLVAGLAGQVRRRTVVGMLLGACLQHLWPHDRAHYSFSRARWQLDELGLVVARLVVDALIGHGAAMVIKDRLLDESDGTIQYVCGNVECGHFAIKDRKGNLRCPVCENTSKIYPVQTSYAFKLLLDELLSLGVVMRLQLEDMR